MILVLVLVVFGAINTILLKIQNIQVIGQYQQQDLKFFHPFVQTLLLFIGQMLVGIVILIQKLTAKNKQSKSQLPKAPYYIILFPTFMDLLATLLSYIALNMVDSSVWQISRGGNIITAALLSKFLLKRVYKFRQILGCVLAFVGITGVQIVTVLFSNNSGQQLTVLDQMIGIGLLIVSIIFNGIGMVSQKSIFNSYEISPFKMVFLQGLFGIMMMIPLVISFQYIECPWSNISNCVFDGSNFYLQNISNFWNQIQNNYLLIILVIGSIISISISVASAMIVSKNISPVSRSLANVSRTVFVWIFGIIMSLTYGKDHESYRIQQTQWLLNVLKAIGFTFLMIGTFMYHNLFPCLAQKKQKQHQSLKESLLQIEQDNIQKIIQKQLQNTSIYTPSSKDTQNSIQYNFQQQNYTQFQCQSDTRSQVSIFFGQSKAG